MAYRLQPSKRGQGAPGGVAATTAERAPGGVAATTAERAAGGVAVTIAERVSVAVAVKITPGAGVATAVNVGIQFGAHRGDPLGAHAGDTTRIGLGLRLGIQVSGGLPKDAEGSATVLVRSIGRVG